MTIPAIFQEFATLLREYVSLSCPSRAELNSGEIGETTFNRFAVALFRLQFAYNNAYRRVCETRKLTPGQVTHWQQIPAVPAAAFKELDLSCLPADHRAAVFHSSGTTGQTPSRHFHNADSLALYDASLSSWFAAHILPEFCTRAVLAGVGPVPFEIPYGLVLLSPSPADVSHSSLVHMFATITRNWKWSESTFLGKLDAAGNWTVNAGVAAAFLQRATELRRAAVILGTAFSFVHLLDEFTRLGLRFQLPTGSRVMETGGYKGRSRALTRPELHSLITERLGVSADNIICEYGMAELSSQAYDRVYSANRVVENPVRCFQFPPWARTQVISPETGEEVSEGETGLLRVFDLANVYSVLAIQTEDLGIRRGTGFELLGRGAKAEPRGCSLASL